MTQFLDQYRKGGVDIQTMEKYHNFYNPLYKKCYVRRALNFYELIHFFNTKTKSEHFCLHKRETVPDEEKNVLELKSQLRDTTFVFLFK